jgi:hypothetical protein
MLGRALTIDEQRARMKAVWPVFTVRSFSRASQEAHWIGEVQPQFARFTLKVHYRLGDVPHVRVVRPSLVRLPDNPEGQLPHVYPPADDPTLCLFDPASNQWDPSMAIAETTLPWAFDWIACYELWLMTGRWTGGGRHASAAPQLETPS